MSSFSRRHEDLLLRQWNVDPASSLDPEPNGSPVVPGLSPIPPQLLPMADRPARIISNLASVITASRTTLTVSITSSDAASSVGPSPVAEPVEVKSLLRDLEEGKKLTEPVPVKGMFFPSILLFEGWWNRRPGAATVWHPGEDEAKKIMTVHNIQNWLNRGFEQWGPSWDLTSQAPGDSDLYGQLGHGDESNSIPIIIAPEKAKRVRAQMEADLVMPAEVRGLVCHRDEIPKYFKDSSTKVLERLDRAPARIEHFVIVLDDDDLHSVERKGASDIYSAYLWQCLVRTEDEQRAEAGDITLDEVIFLWEHTNLSDPDSIKFNYDALHHKKRYLEDRVGSLSVLHQSYDVDKLVGVSTKLLVPNSDVTELFARARSRLADQ